jgi:hypothetical protein
VHGVNLKADIPVSADGKTRFFLDQCHYTLYALLDWSWTKTARQLLTANFGLAIETLTRQLDEN